MADPKGTAEAEDGLADADRAGPGNGDGAPRRRAVSELIDGLAELGEDLDSGEDAPGQDAPRRRPVSELLEGLEEIEVGLGSDAQLVATPVHADTVDMGQPIYQLDMSGDEPEGEIVASGQERVIDSDPDAAPVDAAVEPETGDQPVDASADVDARPALRELISQRDRQIMAAERDGIAAYEMAADIDTFIESVLAAVNAG